MRIAIVTPGYSRDDHDWCIPALQDFVTGLSSKHEVRVYATCYPHAVRDYKVKGVTVRSFGDGKVGRLPWLRRQARTVRALNCDHKSNPFDLIHGFWADGGGVVAAGFQRKHATPVVVTVMAGELTYEPLVGYGKRKRPIAGRLARFGARRADALIALSRFHADRLRMEEPELDPQIVPFGYDAVRFSPLGQQIALQGDTAVLCVASLLPVKGHGILMQALAAASTQVPGLHLHLVGKGEAEPELRRDASRLGIEKSVTFHGHIEHDHLAAYYRGASFCVMPSYFESQAMVVVEAAGCGRVTIGMQVGSMQEFCAEKFLSQPGDVEGLTQSISILATDVRLRQSMSEHALTVARDHYAIAQSGNAVEAAYAALRRLST